MGYTFLMTVIISHMLVVFGNVVSIFVIPFCVPWYIALPLISVIINLLFMPVECPLTKLENRIRKSLGLRQIRHFVGHYLVWPVKRFLRREDRSLSLSSITSDFKLISWGDMWRKTGEE